MDGLNDSLRDLSCFGVTIQSTYTEKGILIINGLDSNDFIKKLKPTKLMVNIHLTSDKKLLNYGIIRKLSLLNQLCSIILSSSRISRQSLNDIREKVWHHDPQQQHGIFVAALEDVNSAEIEYGDMIYSYAHKNKYGNEYNRLTSYVKDDIPVLLDWYDNYEQRLSTMIERTNNSDNLLIITRKPKTVRRIVKSHYNN